MPRVIGQNVAAPMISCVDRTQWRIPAEMFAHKPKKSFSCRECSEHTEKDDSNSNNFNAAWHDFFNLPDPVDSNPLPWRDVASGLPLCYW
jgi:hypothetical protein